MISRALVGPRIIVIRLDPRSLLAAICVAQTAALDPSILVILGCLSESLGSRDFAFGGSSSSLRIR